MIRTRLPMIIAVTLWAGSAWAGGGSARVAAPTLGEAGLVALGLALVATGAAFLRRR